MNTYSTIYSLIGVLLRYCYFITINVWKLKLLCNDHMTCITSYGTITVMYHLFIPYLKTQPIIFVPQLRVLIHHDTYPGMVTVLNKVVNFPEI